MDNFRLFLIYCMMCTKHNIPGVTYAEFIKDKELIELTLQFMITQLRNENYYA